MLGPSGTGKSVFLKTLVGLLKPERGSIMIEGRDLVTLREADLYEVRKLFGVLFQDGALFGSMNLYDNIAFPLREHTTKTRVRDQEDRHARRWRWSGLTRLRGQAARRDLRRHAQAGRPGPRAGARPRDHPVRRARLRPRPGPHGLPQPADRRPQRRDPGDVPDRHPRRQHRAHGARQHRAALPPAPGDVRPARDAAVQRGAGRPAVPQRPAAGPDRHGRGEGRRRARAGGGRGLRAAAAAADPAAAAHQRRATPARPSARPAPGAARTASPRRPGRSSRTAAAAAALAASRRAGAVA